MRTPNLHLPHLHMPRFGHADAVPSSHHRSHQRAPSYVWAMLLTAIVALVFAIGLWMSTNPAWVPNYLPPL